VNSNRLILALDIGTTTCKTAIFDLATKKHYIVLNEYGLDTPRPGWIELDPEKIWDSIVSGVKEVLSASGHDPKDVTAISYSVLGCAVAPIDKDGNVLYPFIEGWDARDDSYKKYFDLIDKKVGLREVFEITGNYLTYGSLNKILWLRDNKKEIFDETWKFLCVGDYITYKLTGKPIIDYSMAANMLVFDNRKKDYSSQILESVGLESDFFAEPVQAGTVAGEITDDAAGELGISKDAKVVVGAHDQTCAAIGVGNIKEGMVSDGLGTVECIGITTDDMMTTDDMFNNMYPSYPHAVDGKYFSFGVQLSSGLILKWYKDVLCAAEIEQAQSSGRNAYDIIIEDAMTSELGAKGILVLPHLRGGSMGIDPPLNMTSKCAIVGLDMAHNKSDISRAILESVAYESRVLLEGLEGTGVSTDTLKATGGGTKSDDWLQIRSDIINKKIVVPEFKDAGLLGAIILAAKGTEYFNGFDEAVEELVKIEKTIYPNKDKNLKYSRYFKAYKGLYRSLLNTHEVIAKIRG